MAPLATALAALLVIASSTAAAQVPSDARVRTTGALGYVLSADQHALYGLSLPVLEGAVRAGWVVAEPVVLELGVGAGAYFADGRPPGGLIDATLGAEVGVGVGAARLWLSAHVGAGITGDLLRPMLRMAIGADLAIDRVVAVGPTLGYAHLFQLDGPERSDDAIALSVGLSATFRPTVGGPPPPAPPPAPAIVRRPVTPDPAPPPLPEAELMAMLDEAAGLAPRELLVPVLFEFDSTAIVACTVPSLHRLREHLAAHPEIRRLEIEGHADGQGDAAYNASLGLRRAEAIRDWLVERGIEPSRLAVASRGERAPVEDNGSDAGRTQNRRARFLVVSEAR